MIESGETEMNERVTCVTCFMIYSTNLPISERKHRAKMRCREYERSVTILVAHFVILYSIPAGDFTLQRLKMFLLEKYTTRFRKQ